jgi:hypothetical protein
MTKLSSRSGAQRTENPCVDSSILSLGTGSKNRTVDYVAARVALGVSPAQAQAASARARRLGKRVASGQLSLQRAAEILGVAELMAGAQ